MLQILFIAVALILFVVAYFTTARDRYLTRMEFFVRLLILLVFGIGISFLASSQAGNSDLGALVVLICGLLVGYFSQRFHIMRLKDLRWSPFLALVSLVPFVNFVFVFVLLFVPGKPKVNSEIFS
ncbi:uncharacterized membrane protein YhaH (DUF805 family) [Labrenzia sp. EL_195]|nr:uncharacterized membrane protein YhaH (DUF805 family) [Labrenzia sp. EL_195]